MQRNGLKVETCVYPWYAGSDDTRMLLGRQRSDLNAGLWVPLGTQVDERSFPLGLAARDLTERGFSVDSLRLAGLVTEVGQNGWQTHLLLFAAEQNEMLDIAPDDFAVEYVWISPDEAQSLNRPVSDAGFDYSFLTPTGSY